MNWKHAPAAVFFSLFCLLAGPKAGPAWQLMLPAPNPSPNGAYLLCADADFARCYELRERYYRTNSQLEHLADRLLLRTGGSGYLETSDSVLRLTWTAPRGDSLWLEFEGGTLWEFVPRGPFLLNEAADKYFIFVRSEREYEDTDGGELAVP